MPYAVARILTGLVTREAARMGVPMSVAVTGEEGGLRAFISMDGALPASVEIAVNKAYTAAILRMPTHELGELARPGGTLYGIQEGHGGRIVLFGGGFPLKIGGRVVGGLGVSGGTVEEDMRAAEPALRALSEMERWAETLAPVMGNARIAPLGLEELEQRLSRELFRLDVQPPPETISLLAGAMLFSWPGRDQDV